MNDQAVGPTHDTSLAHHVLNSHLFDPVAAIREFGGEKLQATRESIFTQLTPLKVAEPKLDGPQAKMLRRYLTVIGQAMMPTMSASQAESWLNAVVLKLSDLPPRCAQEAASKAVHQAFGYIAEAEQFIRLTGDQLHTQQRIALARLDLMQKELHRLRNPKPMLAPPDPVQPMSDEEVHEWQGKGDIGRAVLRVGLAGGWIQPHQLQEPLPPEEERT